MATNPMLQAIMLYHHHQATTPFLPRLPVFPVPVKAEAQAPVDLPPEDPNANR